MVVGSEIGERGRCQVFLVLGHYVSMGSDVRILSRAVARLALFM